MEYPERKQLRLKGFDYSNPGKYFVTICTFERKNLLSDIILDNDPCSVPQIALTNIGNEIEKAIQYINDNYKDAKVEKYVIMPNHIHLIMMLDESGGHGNPPLQNIIGQLKSYTTRKYGSILWQRSYHDHIIRNEQDYKKIWDYIESNPNKWTQDRYYCM